MAKLNHQPLNERVYQYIREAVINGAIPPNGRIDEQAFADEIGVSRTPIREAIGKLTREGLVEYRPYQGNFVRAFTPKQVNDLYEVRAALEGLAMRLAVPRMTAEDIAELRGILDAVYDAYVRDDMVAYGSTDRRFHETIARLSGNDTLIESLGRLAMQVQIVRTAANRNPDVVERAAHQRPAILAALEARDAERAAKLMEAHIEDVRRAVVAQLEHEERAAEELVAQGAGMAPSGAPGAVAE